MSHLKAGDKAPEIAGVDQDGAPVSLNDYSGKRLILFFYPKDDTPGCTAAACNLRDNYQDLTDKGFEMLGVSADTEKKHKKFATKYGFPFRLLADTEKEVIEGYGAWGPKKFMGREYEGILRSTFIIGEDGNIEHIIRKVKTKDHTNQILTELETLEH